MCKQKSTNFTPGAQYSYSNSNYSLLVTIVERVSKKSLQQFTDSVFFKPLKMTKTQWRDNFREVVLNRSIAYSRNNGTYEQLMPFEHVHGHGGLLTTTADLLAWNKLLESNSIISNRVAGWRIQKGKLNDGSEITYASGLVNRTVNGFQEISHSGATAGYRAWLAYYPQKKLSVAILNNDGNYRDVSGQIAEIFLGKEIKSEKPEPTKFIQLTEAEKKSWAGVYKRTEGMDMISFDYKNNQLLTNGREVKAIHRDTLYLDRFWWIRSSSEKILLKNQNGTSGYARVAPADTSPLALQTLQGTYTSEEAEATYLISLSDKELFLQIDAHPKIKLIPMYRNGYRDDDYVLYEFKTDKNNKVTGLLVSVSRALNVPFVKR
jgi:Beta-lactamase class C and other penicillin binding proteins